MNKKKKKIIMSLKESFRNFWNNNYIEYESNDDENRNLSLDEYPNKIETYLRNIIINLQNSDAWKIPLKIAKNFISSKDTEEERVMHLSSDNIKFISYSKWCCSRTFQITSFKISGRYRNINEREWF